MLVEAFLQHGLPGYKLEAEPVLDHGEAPAGEIGDAHQPAGYILALAGRGVGRATLGRHLLADSLDLLALQRRDRAPGNRNEAVLLSLFSTSPRFLNGMTLLPVEVSS